MIINADIYKLTTCFFPAFLILFSATFVIFCVRGLIFNHMHLKNRFINLIASTFGILIAIMLFIYPSILSLSNGGIYMLTEEESDFEVASGEIESFTYPSKRVPTYKGEYGDNSLPFGVDIVVDGKTYFMPYIEGFEEGDKVIIKYLPKSKFILSIDTVDQFN